ncbi:MAG TPA: outer membrane beta-barrel protein [Fibrobacteria bacterium]|nr:outer membrane beta-barrel protein [Fibrobacteria bacterium]
MKKLNKLPLALTILGLGAASSFAAIPIGDSLSVSGFLDMSANGMAPDTGDATLNAAVDQFEIDFMLKFGYFSARADINSIGPTGAVSFEQGFVTAALTEGLTVSVGKFLSSSGFEAAEPTGLYQYSVSKLMSGCATGAPNCVYGGYQNGLNVAYAAPKFALYGSVVTSVWGTDVDLKTPGFEAQLALMPVEGLTAKVTGLYEMYDDTTSHDSQSELNVWAQYVMGPLTVAAEYSMLMDWMVKGESGNGWLAMANYKLTDKIAATVRYSGIKMESADDPDTEVTFSPSFAVAPNWLALAEVRYEIEGDTAPDIKGVSYAVESTFSF